MTPSVLARREYTSIEWLLLVAGQRIDAMHVVSRHREKKDQIWSRQGTSAYTIWVDDVGRTWLHVSKTSKGNIKLRDYARWARSSLCQR
jgi:hypothetical protein